MQTSKEELRATILKAKQKLRDLAAKGSDKDLIDICTLNLLLDSAIKKLKEIREDENEPHTLS